MGLCVNISGGQPRHCGLPTRSVLLAGMAAQVPRQKGGAPVLSAAIPVKSRLRQVLTVSSASLVSQHRAAALLPPGVVSLRQPRAALQDVQPRGAAAIHAVHPLGCVPGELAAQQHAARVQSCICSGSRVGKGCVWAGRHGWLGWADMAEGS